MEKYTMFMDGKNQYSENEYTTKSNLQIQCNPYQTANGIFHRTRTNNFRICMEIQKTLNSWNNLEEEEWNWRNQLAWLQTILQSHSHQKSMVLAQRQKYRSLGFLFCSIDLYFCLCASTILSWWLWLYSRAWSQASWFLQFHSSFSRLLWLFEVFCISIQILKWFVLVLWKIWLVAW